jgi:hypothetical protein
MVNCQSNYQANLKEKNCLFNKSCLNTWICREKKNLNPDLIPHKKINLKYVKNLSIGTTSIKSLEEGTEKYLPNFRKTDFLGHKNNKS